MSDKIYLWICKGRNIKIIIVILPILRTCHFGYDIQSTWYSSIFFLVLYRFTRRNIGRSSNIECGVNGVNSEKLSPQHLQKSKNHVRPPFLILVWTSDQINVFPPSCKVCENSRNPGNFWTFTDKSKVITRKRQVVLAILYQRL